MKKISLLLLILALVGLWPLTVAAAAADAFITPSGFYILPPEPVEGQTARIYARVDLRTADDVQGVVAFFVDGKQVGSAQSISIVGGRSDEVFVDWVPNHGGHFDFKAVVTLTSEEDANPRDNAVAMKDLFVDYDTDGDKVPNSTDIDDDNDGLNDKEEVKIGTDPLKTDTDGDGLNDRVDPQPLTANKDFAKDAADGNSDKNDVSPVIPSPENGQPTNGLEGTSGGGSVSESAGGSVSESAGGSESGSAGGSVSGSAAGVFGSSASSGLANGLNTGADSIGSNRTDGDQNLKEADATGITTPSAQAAAENLVAAKKALEDVAVTELPSSTVSYKVDKNGVLQIDAAKFVSHLGENAPYILSFLPESGGFTQYQEDNFSYRLSGSGLFNAVLEARDLQGNVIRTRISIPVKTLPLAGIVLGGGLSALILLLIFLSRMRKKEAKKDKSGKK